MRKLHLASFSFRHPEDKPAPNGDIIHHQQRLVAITVVEGEEWETMRDRAQNDIFKPWFKREYQGFELLTFNLLETLEESQDMLASRIMNQIHRGI